METNKHKTYARIKQRKVLASYIITPCTSEQIAGVGCARVCAVSAVDERKSNNGHVWALADTQVRWLGSSSSDKVMSVIHISNGHYQILGSGERVGDRPRTTVFRTHHAMSTEELSRAIVNKVSASMQ